MKVIYVINDITMPGGLSTVTKGLARDLSISEDIDVKVISAAHKYEKPDIHNVSYLDLSPLHGRTVLGKISWYISLGKKLREYVKSENPDVLISVGTAMSLFIALFKIKGKRTWAAEHTAYSNSSQIRRVIRKYLYKKFNTLVVLTNRDKDRYYDKEHNDVRVIPNYTHFATREIETHYENNSLLYVGRFTDTKGIDLLCDIMSSFLLKNKQWTCTFIGEGPEQHQIESLRNDVRIGHQVSILPPTDVIEEYYKKASILLLTSRNEGFPMVLIEALSFGIPVVSFDCETGPAEIITDTKDGFLIPLFDTCLFETKLSDLASNELLRKDMSKTALNKRTLFSKDTIINKWIEELKK